MKERCYSFMHIFLFQSHLIWSNFNIVIVSSRSWSDINIIFLFDWGDIGMSSLVIWNKRLGFRGRSLTDLIVLVSIISLVKIWSGIYDSLLNILKVMVFHLFHVCCFIWALKCIVILFLGLDRVGVVVFTFRNAHVRLGLWLRWRILLIDSYFYNFGRYRSLDRFVFESIHIPNFIAYRRSMCILWLRHDVWRMLGWNLIGLFKLSSSLLWNIMQLWPVSISIISQILS